MVRVKHSVGCVYACLETPRMQKHKAKVFSIFLPVQLFCNINSGILLRRLNN